MKKVVLNDEKIEKLIQYYKDKGLLIVGLNDSQGVNTTSAFCERGLLEYLASALTSTEFTPEVINAFSMMMNKTEHLDYLLKNNLSLEEIKLSQIYSIISTSEKITTDMESLRKIDNACRLVYTPKKGDEKINITTSLKQAQEPVMIYSSGINDLMREVYANPLGLKDAYQAKDEKPNYYYTLERAKDPKTLKIVIDAIERNYNHILGINAYTDIYTLGAYIPKSLQSEAMNVFRDLILAYNERLLRLCKQYGITFIDTEEIGNHYNHSELNFHISTAGHNALANNILGYMYQNKITSQNSPSHVSHGVYEISNQGSQGMIEDLSLDYKRSYTKAMTLCGFLKERELADALEHRREIEVFQKVLTRKTK